MKFKFKIQQYQTDSLESTVMSDPFAWIRMAVFGDDESYFPTFNGK